MFEPQLTITHIKHNYETKSALPPEIQKLRIYQISRFATVCLLKLYDGRTQIIGTYVGEEGPQARALLAYDAAMRNLELWRLGIGPDDLDDVEEDYLELLDDIEDLRNDAVMATATDIGAEQIVQTMILRLTSLLEEHDDEDDA